MPTPFETAAAMVSAATDTVYGESFTFIAMKVGADVDRELVRECRTLPAMEDAEQAIHGRELGAAVG